MLLGDNALLVGLIAFGIAGVGATVHAQIGHARQVKAEWARRAGALGLQVAVGGVRMMKGSVRGHGVVVTQTSDGEAAVARLVVIGTGLLPNLAFSRARSVFAADDVVTGDAVFDKLVHVDGPPGMALAALTGDARRRLMSLFAAGRATVKGARIEVTLPRGHDEEHEIWEALGRMVDVADSLTFPAEMAPRRLANTARTDPQADVRRRCLATLAREFGTTKSAREAARSALDDADAGIRLAGARMLGREGTFDTLVGLASDPGLVTERIDAIAMLASAFPFERLGSVVDGALRASNPEVRAAGMRAIGEGSDVFRLAQELSVFSLTKSPDELEATFAVIRKLAYSPAEPLLVRLLEHPDESVRRSVVGALGEVGGRDAVEPLVALAKSLILPGALKEATRDAVQQIQARLGNVDAGRISLALTHDAEGALSVAGAGGDLSLAADPSSPKRTPVS